MVGVPRLQDNCKLVNNPSILVDAAMVLRGHLKLVTELHVDHLEDLIGVVHGSSSSSNLDVLILIDESSLNISELVFKALNSRHIDLIVIGGRFKGFGWDLILVEVISWVRSLVVVASLVVSLAIVVVHLLLRSSWVCIGCRCSLAIVIVVVHSSFRD